MTSLRVAEEPLCLIVGEDDAPVPVTMTIASGAASRRPLNRAFKTSDSRRYLSRVTSFLVIARCFTLPSGHERRARRRRRRPSSRPFGGARSRRPPRRRLRGHAAPRLELRRVLVGDERLDEATAHGLRPGSRTCARRRRSRTGRARPGVTTIKASGSRLCTKGR